MVVNNPGLPLPGQQFVANYLREQARQGNLKGNTPEESMAKGRAAMKTAWLLARSKHIIKNPDAAYYRMAFGRVNKEYEEAKTDTQKIRSWMRLHNLLREYKNDPENELTDQEMNNLDLIAHRNYYRDEYTKRFSLSKDHPNAKSRIDRYDIPELYFEEGDLERNPIRRNPDSRYFKEFRDDMLDEFDAIVGGLEEGEQDPSVVSSVARDTREQYNQFIFEEEESKNIDKEESTRLKKLLQERYRQLISEVNEKIKSEAQGDYEVNKKEDKRRAAELRRMIEKNEYHNPRKSSLHVALLGTLVIIAVMFASRRRA